jgi:hypothetical protein
VVPMVVHCNVKIHGDKCAGEGSIDLFNGSGMENLNCLPWPNN